MCDNEYGEFEFSYQHHNGSPVVSVRLHPDATIDETLQAFEQFLLAAGYVFRGKIMLAEYPDVDMPQEGTVDEN